MDRVLLIVQGILALVFLGAGLMKLRTPYAAMVADSKMDWVKAFSPGFVRFLGLAEILGGLGLILPRVTGVAPLLVPVAAAGLLVIMLGAIGTHLRRKEGPMVVPPLLLALALGYLVYRFLPFPPPP